MFLMTIQNSINYRQKDYFSLLVKCCEEIENFKFTGRGFTKKDIEKASVLYPVLKECGIPWKENIKLSDIETENGKVDTLFLFDVKSLNVDVSLKNKKTIVMITDYLKKDDERIQDYKDRNLNFEEVDYVLYLTRYMSSRLFKIFKNAKCINFPVWVSEEYNFKNLNNKKIYDYLLSGNTDPEYPWREKYRSLLRSSLIYKNFIDNLKPQSLYSVPYSEFRKNGPEFKNLISSSVFCLCDGGVNGRVVTKYYEAMYSQSIVVTPDNGENLKLGGIIDGETAIVHPPDITNQDLINILSFPERYYDIEKIKNNAYNMVLNNFTVERRVELIKKIIEENYDKDKV